MAHVCRRVSRFSETAIIAIMILNVVSLSVAEFCQLFNLFHKLLPVNQHSCGLSYWEGTSLDTHKMNHNLEYQQRIICAIVLAFLNIIRFSRHKVSLSCDLATQQVCNKAAIVAGGLHLGF
jgi:hypothetical protein